MCIKCSIKLIKCAQIWVFKNIKYSKNGFVNEIQFKYY